MRNLEDIFREVETTPDFDGHKINSVTYRNGWGDTPLHIVSNWGDCEAVKILTEAGADINARGETGFTPLHCAAEQNHPQAVRLLLLLGAEIVEDANGDTPIALADIFGHQEVIEILRNGI